MAKRSTKRGRGKAKAARPARKKTAVRKAAGKPKARGASKRTASKRTARPAAAARRPDPLRALADRIVAITVANDDEATLGLYAPDVESIEMSQPPLSGLDSIKQKMQMWRSMTSSASFEPHRVLVGDDTIIIEWIGTVTLASSGKTVELKEVAVHEIKDGKIARERFYYDPATLQ